MKKTLYGTLDDGREVYAFTLDNGTLKAQVLTLGAAVDKLWVPGKDGKAVNVLIGHPDLAHRVAHNHCQGEIAGRYANRVGGAKFELNGREYRVTVNQDGPTCLHGAHEFNTALWEGEQTSESAVELRYTSPDGTHGFPGTLQTLVRYTLEGGSLLIEYEAQCDGDTVVNLTNHAYFNLAGQGQIFNQLLQIDAPHFLPLNENLVPTGDLQAVDGTRFDFRAPRPIEQIYDVNFCNPAAIEAVDPASGLRMTVTTDQPGVQLYTGECLEEPFTGFCLETQTWPDGPNKPWKDQCVLKAGEVFKSWTRYAFS